MRIGGIQKLSLIDYPGRPASVVFTIGCNLRCPYCHNPELVLPEHYPSEIDPDGVIAFLTGRWPLVDGVVITGGEPTLQKDLPEFCKKLKGKGLRVKVDTNGTQPKVIRQLIVEKLADYIAMDVKAPLARYREVAGVDVDVDAIRESIDLLKAAPIPREFRTTFAPPLVDEADLAGIRELIGPETILTLQPFRGSTKMLDPDVFVTPAARISL